VYQRRDASTCSFRSNRARAARAPPADSRSCSVRSLKMSVIRPARMPGSPPGRASPSRRRRSAPRSRRRPSPRSGFHTRVLRGPLPVVGRGITGDLGIEARVWTRSTSDLPALAPKRVSLIAAQEPRVVQRQQHRRAAAQVRQHPQIEVPLVERRRDDRDSGRRRHPEDARSVGPGPPVTPDTGRDRSAPAPPDREGSGGRGRPTAPSSSRSPSGTS
jgi:hypothetical protein